MNELTKGCSLQHGKYKIVKVLGRGSFGITYLATTKVALSGGLGKMDVTVNVAIKEFFMEEFNSRSRDGSSVDGTNASLVKNYRKKFYREAENLSKLRHPNIVKVLEVFDENNTTYYAMEYVNGESLDDYIKSKGRIPEEEALTQLKDIGEALQYMHDNKMLHLDLKPRNVMRNNDGHLLLIDFGLSKQYDQNGEPESSTTLGLGTPGYAPIEQANYKQDGTFPATLDIYALGATVYKMLTGSTPPHASDILSDGFPEDLFAKLGISSETTSMVEKAMSPIKKKRFQTALELLEDVQNKTKQRKVTIKSSFGTYKKVEGEAGYGTEEIINVEIDDPLPMPDGVIKISLKNPESGSLSFDFVLNDNGRNNVIVYRGKKELLDEYWWGDIGNDVIDALKRNGFFSKVHWERESSTSPLTGITVSCTFFYKNGDSFVREIKHANPSYHRLLLDAVHDVVNVNELSQWIYKALEKECSCSREDIESYGISIFSVMPNYEMPIYYRGHIYSGDKIGIYGIKNYPQLTATFDYIKYYLQKSDTKQLDLDSYLKNHKAKIDKSFNIITYCSESDLLKILYKLRQDPSAFGRCRILQEMQLLTLCHDNLNDEIVAYEYQNLYCETEFGGGVVEILQSGYIESKEDYTSVTIVKKLSNVESFASLILGFAVLYHIRGKSWEDDTVLLNVMPFAINAELWIQGRYRDSIKLIRRNTTIPCKKMETITDDNCTVVILFLGKRFSIDVKELFGYNPYSIELIADIDANTRIKFVFKDKEMKKEISISQTEIFSYEVKTYNEDTIWQA